MAGFADPEFGRVFLGRRVLVTGHTGFKGGWLSVWLNRLGAHVTGVSLPPESGPTFHDACDLPGIVDSRHADIRNPEELASALGDVDAEIVFHLAAQPLVRESCVHPAEFFETNVVGTANVLDAARRMESLRAVIVATSNKCYDNREWAWGYRENDPLGGRDPYSASKGCAELVAQSYGHAFFSGPKGPHLATVRAGNVFGGGDWGKGRLVPDIMRSAFAREPVQIRSPFSVRPWQHVLEPLSGYLCVAQQLVELGEAYSGAWNFGPDLSGTVKVRDLTAMIQMAWGRGAPSFVYPSQNTEPADGMHEAAILRLDSTKAQTRLGWRAQLGLPKAIEMTVDWYRAHAAGNPMTEITHSQVSRFSALMAAGSGGATALAAQ